MVLDGCLEPARTREERRHQREEEPTEPTATQQEQAVEGSQTISVYGEELQVKEDNTARVISIQFNTYPNTHWKTDDKLKIMRLKALVLLTDADVATTQEDSTNWAKLPAENRPRERCKNWFKRIGVHSAYNQNLLDKPGTYLPGGVSVWSMNEAVGRFAGNGVDASMLGRWCYTRLRGRNGIRTRVYSVYRPCATLGLSTVHSQHIAYLTSKSDARSPQQAFLEDLTVELQAAKAAGDQLIIGGDFNLDLTSDTLNEFMDTLELKNVILDRHQAHQTPPATYFRGSKPVDGFLISRTLQVSGCGWLHRHCSPGDHLVSWIDTGYHSIYGNELPCTLTKTARRLQMHDVHCWQRYNRSLEKSLVKDNAIIVTANLYQRAVEDPTIDAKEEFHYIIETMSTAMKASAKSCRKFNTGSIEWSPAAGQARAASRYWKLIVRLKQDKTVCHRSLRNCKADLPTEFQIDTDGMSLARAHRISRAADKHKLEISQQSEDLRLEFKTRVCAANALANNTKALSEEKKMMNRELQQKAAAITRAAMPSKRANAVNTLDAPVDPNLPNGPRHRVTTKEEVEKAALHHLVRHIRQTYADSPALAAPFIEEFGTLNLSPASDEVLDGTYTPPEGTDIYLQDLLKQFKRHPDAQPIPSEVTPEELSKLIGCLKEKTATSPDSVHFGHFLAINKNPTLLAHLAKIVSIPLLLGFSPQLYQRMLVCLLEKKVGVIRADKMRAIWLLNAFYSLSCRILAKRTMDAAEKLGVLAPENFGGRKDMSAGMHTVNLRLSMDISLQLRIPMSVTPVDLTACYDRKIHSILCMALERLGHKKQPLTCRFATVQNLEVTVRTAFGDSELSSDHELFLMPMDQPAQGGLQGTADGPANWAVLCGTMLAAVRDKGFGAVFKCSISKGQKIKFLGCVFVDDATYLQTSLSNSAADVIQRTQAAQTYLGGIVRATGGAINPSKSFWWMIDFKWKAGKATVATIEDCPAELQIRDSQGNMQVLQRLEVNKSERILGAQVAPVDNGQAQTEVLRKKVEDWVAQLRRKRMNPTLGWLAITTRILKGIQWPLVASMLSVKQCKRIMAPLRKALKLAGVQARISNRILYGSMAVQGLELPFAYTTMGIDRLLHVTSHAHKQNMTGDLLRSSFENLQLELGLPGNIFTQDYSHWKYLATRTWVAETWRFSNESGIVVDAKIRELPVKRVFDSFLMTHFFEQGFRKGQLKTLQRVCQFLQVNTVADIATMDGTTIRARIFDGRGPQDGFRTWQEWPQQRRPTESAWHEWRRAINTLTEPHHPRRLRYPLGDWLAVPDETWNWYIDLIACRLYRKFGDSWAFYIHVGAADRPCGGYYTGPHYTAETPATLQRAHVTLRPRANAYQCRGFAPAPVPPPETAPPSFAATLAELEPLQRFLLHQIEYDEVRIQSIANAIQAGTLRVVSDGSFYETTQRAAFQVRLEDPASQHQINVTQHVPGDPSYNDSYRAEASGILAGLITVLAICKYKNIIAGGGRFGCDGEAALNKSFDYGWDVRYSDSHHDILQCIHMVRDQIPFQFQKHWISSHPEARGIPYWRLDRMSQMNYDCDLGAKARAQLPLPPDLPKNVQSQSWGILINGVRIISDIESKIRKHIHDPELLEYWHEKGRLPRNTDNKIDWPALAQAKKSTPRYLTIGITKLFSHNCATGVKMALWGYRANDHCPRCGALHEDVSHILTCQAVSAKESWSKSLDRLEEWMAKQKTATLIRQFIIRRLREWHTGEFLVQPEASIATATDEQNEIGWKNLLYGFVSPQWARIQQREYNRIGSRRTGRRWVTQLIKQLWVVIWDQWKDRNKKLHDGDTMDEFHDLSDVHIEINHEFASGAPANCPAHLRYWFRYETVDEILELSNFEQRLWLRTVRAIRTTVALRQANIDGLAAERAFMHAWLATA